MQDLTKLPLHEVLMANGFVLDRVKSSRNYPMLVDRERDLKLIISKKGENYLYFNPHDDTDRGNIISYARIHNQDIKELVAKYDSSIKTAKQYNHSFFDSTQMQMSDKRIINDYKKFPVCDTQNNRLLEIRGFDKDYMQQFKNLLKQDEYGNIIIPNYKHNTEYNVTSICGYTKRLILPINKDKEGNLLEKPIKNIQYGKKGLEILIDKQNAHQTKHIVISESIFDSIAYAQIKNLNIENTILLSTSGAFNTESIKPTLNNIIENLQEKRKDPALYKPTKQVGKLIDLDVRLAFDNDERGRNLTQSIKDFMLQEYGYPVMIYEPFTKDCNDDLRLQNLTGIKNFNNEEYRQWLNSKIIDYQATTIIKNPNTEKRREILKAFRKADSLKAIPEQIKTEINKLSKIGHKAIKSL